MKRNNKEPDFFLCFTFFQLNLRLKCLIVIALEVIRRAVYAALLIINSFLGQAYSKL